MRAPAQKRGDEDGGIVLGHRDSIRIPFFLHATVSHSHVVASLGHRSRFGSRPRSSCEECRYQKKVRTYSCASSLLHVLYAVLSSPRNGRGENKDSNTCSDKGREMAITRWGLCDVCSWDDGDVSTVELQSVALKVTFLSSLNEFMCV